MDVSMPENEPREILVGTRGSELALAQAGLVVEQLRALWPQHTFTIKAIATAGDRFADAAIPRMGVTGVFTSEIERGLLNGTIDIAVHSLKDMPTAQPEGLAIAAMLTREDPRDALVSREGRKLAELPERARVGTGSIRRAAQLRAYRRDLDLVSIRGNVPTRLRKLDELKLDSIVLAAAGLVRLGQRDVITELLDPELMIPAAGQGVVAVQTRVRDGAAVDLVRPLENAAARVEALAERQLVELLGGGCHAPIGVLARARDDRVTLSAAVVMPDGSKAVRAAGEGNSRDWRDVTWKMTHDLREGGATDILKKARRGGG
jgi:hydroxymethylbilane synthase